MLSIFLLAIVFWITEAVPLTATAVLVILLEVLLVAQGALGNPTAADPALAEAALPASTYFAALANPVIILFLGGFMIADGAENRTIVSGIAQYYQPEDLVGKQVCFVANLAPRTINGIESQGMILSAVNFDDSLSVVTVDRKVVAGSQVG